MNSMLPPGPRQPRALQTLGWWTRAVPFMDRCHRRHGSRFTIRLVGQVPFVMLSDPDDVREMFTAPDTVLHPGEGARVLEPVVGRHSVILLDERDHLEQRRLMLPAFHGEKMQRLAALMGDVAKREAARWPRGEPVQLHPRLQAMTLEIILRAVFGLDPGERLDALREKLTDILTLAARPMGMLPPLQHRFGPRSAWARFLALREETDGLLFELIEERREGGGARDDVLAMLLEARREDGSPMTSQELRDELMTALGAAHETTASELAWAFERLVRTPAVLDRLVAELDHEDGGDAYLTATIQETLRRRPVLPNSAPRLVKRPVTIGGWSYPAGVSLVANTHAIHHDPLLYPEPYAFRPERFLEEPPGTYTWIPFGGGRRRCLGASFATLEMKLVLRAVLARHEVGARGDGLELSRRRNITLSPGEGAEAVLGERRPVAA